MLNALLIALKILHFFNIFIVFQADSIVVLDFILLVETVWFTLIA